MTRDGSLQGASSNAKMLHFVAIFSCISIHAPPYYPFPPHSLQSSPTYPSPTSPHQSFFFVSTTNYNFTFFPEIWNARAISSGSRSHERPLRHSAMATTGGCVPVAARWHMYVLLNLWDPCLPRMAGCSSPTGVRLPSYGDVCLQPQC